MPRFLSALLLAALSLGASADDLRFAPYGTAKTFDFRILAADGTFVTNATDAGTDVTLTCDDGTPATATNDFVDEGSHYSIALTATELQCARLVVDVADATPNGFIIETYGNASAQHVAFAANVTQFGGSAGTFAGGRPEVNTTHAAGTAWNSGAIGASTLATDTITAAKAAADLTTEFQAGLATSSALTTVGTNVSTLIEALVVLGAEQTADSGTTTTLVDAALTQATDGWFNGMAVHFTSGTLLGQASCVTGFTAASDTLTFSPAVTTAVTTHTYYLLPDAECVTGDAFGRIGAAGAGLTNIDLPNQTMDITGSLSGSVGSVTGAVGSVTGAVGSIASGGISEASFATTAGSLDALGIIDQGTAQAATGTTLQLRAAAAFADDEIIGATCLITGGTAGVGQARTVTDYVSATDTATVAAWTTTPTGTITYECFGTAASSGGGASAADVWSYATRSLTILDEDSTTLDLNATAVGSVAGAVGSVTGAVGSISTGGIAAGSFAAGAIDAASIAADAGTEIGTATWASTTRLLTAGTNIVLAKGTGVTGFNDLSGAQVQTEAEDAINVRLEQATRADAAIINCEVNTANFAGSTTTMACILTDRDAGAITAASNDFEGRELLILSGAQIYEGRFIIDTTWDGANSELRLTLSRALPGTLADAVQAIIR